MQLLKAVGVNNGFFSIYWFGETLSLAQDCRPTGKLFNLGKMFKYIEMVSRDELINVQTKGCLSQVLV